jgi:hypothetical protein
MGQCWDADPEDRPSFAEVIRSLEGMKEEPDPQLSSSYLSSYIQLTSVEQDQHSDSDSEKHKI